MIQGKVFLTRQIPQEAVRLLQHEFSDVEVWADEMPPPRNILIQKARQSVALLCTGEDNIDSELMDNAPSLHVVSNMAVGVDNFDIAAATKRGIALGNTPGVLSATTADLAFALLLATARRVVETDRAVRNGQWKISWHPLHFASYDVHHRSLGIIGLGLIGQEMAKRGLGFDMEILYFSTSRKRSIEKRYGFKYVPELTALLGQSDFVSLHVPLTPNTRHMIGKTQLQAMKRTAFLINTCRGAVVDQQALYDALVDGTIAGVGMDVTDPEPLPLDSPLLTMPNVVITPHIGSSSYETRSRMAIMASENIIAVFKGTQMPACVNPKVFL